MLWLLFVLLVLLSSSLLNRSFYPKSIQPITNGPHVLVSLFRERERERDGVQVP